jgi:glycosyltransferase involved in cell wall biosynthesis
LDELYASARVFAFLSSYEGFALTPLEAIARGVPAVLLDTTVAHEIYERGAALVPPDPHAIGETLRTLLEDDHAHQALLAAGRDLLSRYTWAHTASTIGTALERAAGSR